MLALLHDASKGTQEHAARTVMALMADDVEGLGPAVLAAAPPPGPKAGAGAGGGVGATAGTEAWAGVGAGAG